LQIVFSNTDDTISLRFSDRAERDSWHKVVMSMRITGNHDESPFVDRCLETIQRCHVGTGTVTSSSDTTPPAIRSISATHVHTSNSGQMISSVGPQRDLHSRQLKTPISTSGSALLATTSSHEIPSASKFSQAKQRRQYQRRLAPQLVSVAETVEGHFRAIPRKFNQGDIVDAGSESDITINHEEDDNNFSGEDEFSSISPNKPVEIISVKVSRIPDL
jgi:hypothetical protein